MNIPVVILCGGKGFRLRSEYPEIPKPLVKICGKTILERVMDIYISQGCKEVFLCLGYMGEKIVEYFAGILQLRLYNEKGYLHFEYTNDEKREIALHLIDTGEETTTAGRIKKIEQYLMPYDMFFMTYSDGISDINLKFLLRDHLKNGTVGTLTAVRPNLNFGILDIKNGIVQSFLEKPRSIEWINGGFYLFNNNILEYIKESDTFEIETVSELIRNHLLSAFLHEGTWMCMDTYKDYLNMTEYFTVHE